MNDLFNLERFVDAQKSVYSTVIEELESGIKISHWMWYIFPQVEGLGRTGMAKLYAIKSLDEAKAYVAHPLLGKRLQECINLVLDIDGKSANSVFGYPDNLKFNSSMTLFLIAAPHIDLFQRAINKYYDGQRDGLTNQILNDSLPG